MKLEENIIQSLEEGRFNDPFRILGKHSVKKGKTTFRTYQPNAVKVKVVFDTVKDAFELKPYPDSFLFEVSVDQKKVTDSYHYEVTFDSGDTIRIDDPYQFGPQLSDFDLQIWGEGNHERAYDLMGAHLTSINGIDGVLFTVSAPSANRVSVVGPFNQWDGRRHIMRKYHDQGIWELFIPGLNHGTIYKYEIASETSPVPFLKADPYAFYAEKRPKTASIVYELDGFEWDDDAWIAERAEKQALEAPISIYELHLGSWKRKKTATNEDGFFSYTELATELVSYVKELGYTHIELLPINEHPYDPSWGYQATGYFAPTSRFGNPHELMMFVNECHRQDIGVIVDWVPAHFTKDDHGLRMFDGTHLYEHADPRQGEHKDWGTLIFNFGRTEVMNFLISNACYWIEKFHIDGLRVDAVASMLYLDYSREEGEWIPNKFGGRENLEAIEFIKKFNLAVHKSFPGAITMAEESTAWPMVSRPVYIGGLGFDYKWNMGWMNDTLKYIETDPIFRKYHQNQLTFSMIYAFTENFVLPFSHDEIVHGKKSMLSKMPGDDWQKFANLRLLYAYQYAHPGKKLLFMGCEFGQWNEWNSQSQLDWNLLEFESHQGLKTLVSDLNALYRHETALYEQDYSWDGFDWIDFNDADNSILSFMRKDSEGNHIICVFNFTPVVHHGYRVGVPLEGTYLPIFNSDHERYGGSNVLSDTAYSQAGEWQGQPQFITISIPPLAGIMFKKTV